tara:strand:+ start:2004 stop:2282 length:279 start_codon:yes stop_codon:yes gene_type:complete
LDPLEQIAKLYDQVLLNMLQEGREIVDQKTGEIRQVQVTAADLNVIRQRLKDCGVTDVNASASPIGNILQEMKLRNLKLPDVDSGEDAATAV